MKINKSQFVLSIMLAAILSISTWQIAKAYTTLGHWSSSTQYYRFDSSVPTSYRTYINNGANTWTNVTDSPWTWTSSTSQGVWIYYQNIDGAGNLVGWTNYTVIFGIMTYADMTLDSSENWYAGTGVPGGNQADVQSAATHEMGHALGLGHTSGIYCPGNTNDATMCAAMRVGSYYWRTLEGDDRNGLRYLYP